jgi:hypothetical protein
VSNPTYICKVLYIVESNAVVDDVTLRLEARLEKHGLKKLLIRAHTLKDEKTKVY